MRGFAPAVGRRLAWFVRRQKERTGDYRAHLYGIGAPWRAH